MHNNTVINKLIETEEAIREKVKIEAEAIKKETQAVIREEVKIEAERQEKARKELLKKLQKKVKIQTAYQSFFNVLKENNFRSDDYKQYLKYLGECKPYAQTTKETSSLLREEGKGKKKKLKKKKSTKKRKTRQRKSTKKRKTKYQK